MAKSEKESLQRTLEFAVKKILWEGDSWGKDLRKISTSAMWFMRDGWTVGLSEAEANEYQKAVTALMDCELLTQSYSRKSLIAKWQSFLVHLIDSYEEQPSFDTLQTEIEQWLEGVLTAEEHEFTYYVVIDNLRAEEDRQIGRVWFGPLTEEREAEVKGKIEVLIDQNPYYADKPELLTQLKKDILGTLEGFSSTTESSLAWLQIATRDVLRGQELALEAIEESLHLLRYISTHKTGEIRRLIGIQGEVGDGLRTVPAIAEQSWRIGSERTGYAFNLQKVPWRASDFIKLEEILQKEPVARTQLENKLVGTLVWMGQAVNETSETARLLKVWIGLEMLLTADRERATGKTVGERAAFLLERIPERRKWVAHTLTKIYSIRNALVHQGKPKNEEDIVAWLPYAWALTRRVIARVATLEAEKEWTEFIELKDFVEDLKYS